MDKSLQDLLDIEGVHGLILLSDEGNVVFASPEAPPDQTARWDSILRTIGPSRELDLIYEQGRLYVRRIDAGYLLIRMARTVSISMVKLSCDTVIPKLKPDRKSMFGR